MRGRVVIAVLALAACWSCTPARRPSSSRVQLVPALDDRRLLRDLALTVPDNAAAPALPARSRDEAPPPFAAGVASGDDEQRAADCLSAAVYYEARSEPLDGQRAVAQVVLNRVRDRAFPASVCGVVYQRSSRVCQFSFACDGSMNHPIEPRAWLIAQAVARAALSGSVFAPVGSATHYHTTAILPWWASSLARIGVIGSHIFYRWSDRLGDALSFRQAYSGREVSQVIAAASTPLGAGDAGAIAQRGVTVHRGTMTPRPAGGAVTGRPAGVAAFGVTVHRGVVALAASDEPAADAPVD